jgi:uncharacterized protein YegL
MTRSDLTHIYFLLDRSGSMQSIKTDTEGGFAAFIEEQRSAPGQCRVTLAQFDTHYDVVFTDLDVADVPALDLQPRGSTALLDAMGRLITDSGKQLAATPEADRPGAVIVAIMTDGMENASREWTHPAIKALVEQQSTAYGWQFLYMGADQDAVEVGASLGVHADHSINFARGKAGAAMKVKSEKIRDWRTARQANPAVPMAGFTEEERDRLAE